MSDLERDRHGVRAQLNGAVERGALAGRAAVVALGTLVSRLLGLGREMVLAAIFRRPETDAFYVAFAIPNALRLLLAEGAATSAVVPVLADERRRGGLPAARRLLAALQGVWLVLLIGVSVLGIVAAPWLCSLFAGGFRSQPGQFPRTVLLTRWLFPFLVFVGIAAIGSAALHTHRRFAVPALAPALTNVAIIACALVAPPYLDRAGYDPALALAFGALAGGALAMLLTGVALRRIGDLRWPRWRPGHPAVIEVLRRMLPMAFGTGVYFVNIAVSRRLLSDLGPGPQSYFTWAFRLCALPQGLFAMALSTAALPSLAALAAAGERREVAKTCALGVRLALFVGLPASTLLVVLGHPLVVALFQRGRFGEVAAVETAQALTAQALGIVAVVVVRQIVPVFYALGDTRLPVVASAVNLLGFVGLAVGLRGPLGHPGVGVALSLANLAQLGVLGLVVTRRLPELRVGPLLRSAARIAVVCATAVVAGWAFARQVGLPPDAGGLRRLLPGLGGALLFGVTFLTLARVARLPELGTLSAAIRHRLRHAEPL